MRYVVLFLAICLLVGCSMSKEQKLVKEITSLRQENSVVDTSISKEDSYGHFDTLLESFRNDKDPRAPLVYEVVDQLFRLEELTEKPAIPEFYNGLYVSMQDKESLETFGVNFLVDADLTHIKLLSIQSDDSHRIDYNNRYLRMTDDMRLKLKQILDGSHE